jgi:CHASE3 domain sensor protein
MPETTGGRMSDEQIIALLTEIRDLQKQNVENYRLAMQKQQDAIELQKQHVADFQKKFAVRQKLVVITVIAIVVVAFLIVFVGSEMVRPLH